MLESFNPSSAESQEKPTHKCGIGMIYSFAPTIKTASIISIGNALQHRGQNGVGISASYGRELRRTVADGLLHDSMEELELEKFEYPNHWMMVHMRYGTQGAYNEVNLQPIEVAAKNSEPIHVAVNGNLPNAQYLINSLSEETPIGASDTYIAARTLAQMQGTSWDKKICDFAENPAIKHAANNMFVGVGDTVYVIRDQYGIHPLVIGEAQDGSIAIVSETVALQKIGANIKGEFPPGGIMRIDKNGPVMLKNGGSEGIHRCIFEPDYFMHPNSLFPTYDDGEDYKYPERWMDVMSFRLRCGQIIVQESPVPDIDFVVGMPDSGVPFAHGIANTLGKPYLPVITRSHYNGEGDRTFMQDSRMSQIPLLVRGKHMPVASPDIWKGKKVLKADDSLVRGNTSRETNDMLWRLGVSEIHDYYGFPMVRYPCELGVSFRSQEELVAARCEGEHAKIAAATHATSATFISNEGLIQAGSRVGKSHTSDSESIFLDNGWCGACITGKSPMSPSGNIFLNENLTKK